MPEFLQNIVEWVKKEWRTTLKNFGVKVKEPQTVMTEQKTHYEVNLVPEVKRQMIKAMKFRNIMLFVCIILVAVAGGTVAIMGSVWEGQNLTMSGQDGRLEKMSKKLHSYDALSELLTIQEQLDDIGQINEDKKVLSRVFSILKVILPEGPDTISLSELSVDLSENILRFDAQADAKVSPFIDYRVLESFRKGISLMKYDYGRYVTADGDEIPTRCLVENGSDGNTLVETEEKGSTTSKYIYAYWLKGKNGCDPAREDAEVEEEDQNNPQGSASGGNTNSENSSTEGSGEAQSTEEKNQQIRVAYEGKLETMNEYEKSLANQQLNEGAKMENIDVVKIYRSPKFADWYKDGYIGTDGVIDGVAHFESECITYSGLDSNGVIKWTSDNNCMLSTEDPIIRDSSNGRDSNGNLVLRFNATLTLDSDVFMFKNKHVMAISPSGQNVTDSYRQIEGMFAERAADCADSDVVCTATATSGGSE